MDAGPPRDPEPPTRRTMPWLGLARAVGASFDAKRLILAAVGLVLMRAGWALLDRVLPGSADVTPWSAAASPIDPSGWGDGTLPNSADALAADADLVAAPPRAIVAPFAAVFGLGGDSLSLLHAALAAAWAVLVWGVFGGAICRIAAVQAARDERIGLASAFRFALGRKLPLIGTPLSPLIGVGFLMSLCALLGLLYQIPGPVGATVAGVLAFVPLLLGLVMALILVGLALGWPLMVATVGAEGEDGFDALSRSYSYVYQRPGHYAFYAAVAWLLGTVGAVVVSVFVGLILRLATWGMALGAPDARVIALFGGDPALAGTAPAAVHNFWLAVLGSLAQGWAYSYFWTAAAFIYLLLRLDVDGTPWHDVYAPGREDDTAAIGESAGPKGLEPEAGGS